MLSLENSPTEPVSSGLHARPKWINGWSAARTFEGEFSDVTASYAADKGVVRYAW
jgi:hypothetical protein